MKKVILLITITLLVGTLAVAQSKSGTTASQGSPATPTEAKGISNGPVAEYVADSSATIGWSTHNAGKTSIKYGTDPAHLDQTADAVQSKDGRNHHARLQGLSPDTRYYFQVVQNGEPVGGVGTFMTVASGAAPIKSKANIPE